MSGRVEAATEERFVSVVSGLPRSGTSMMMQMLSAGGLPALSDARRLPDASNPRGYFEFEPVTRLRDDADPGWIRGAVGSCLKVVAPLLPYLPRDARYRVIFMRRDLDEILASQDAMLDRQGSSAARPATDALRSAFASQIQDVCRHVRGRADMRLLFVEYREAIAEPRATAEALNRFLGDRLRIDDTLSAVDPRLYRQRG